MALTAGTRLGPYEIVALIGSGGMGEVYRAHDTKLNRDVAIKVLPDFWDDEERLARFTREARMLASLNHPNIAAIYGFEESGDLRALVSSWSRARISPNGSLVERFHSTKRCRSRNRLRRHSTPPTSSASSTGI